MLCMCYVGVEAVRNKLACNFLQHLQVPPIDYSPHLTWNSRKALGKSTRHQWTIEVAKRLWLNAKRLKIDNYKELEWLDWKKNVQQSTTNRGIPAYVQQVALTLHEIILDEGVEY
jgi:hypothetical protein